MQKGGGTQKAVPQVLVVEESHAGKGHGDTVLIAAIDHNVVTDRSARLGDVGNTAAARALNVIIEWEEGVATDRNTGDRGKVCLFLCRGEGFGALCEVFLPKSLVKNVLRLIRDINVDDVIAVGATKSGEEGEIQHLLMLTQMPDIGLIACKARAMDSRLLTRANADSLTLICIAYGV